MQTRTLALSLVIVAALSATVAEAQFRRGILSEGADVTLYPLEVPVLLLPAGAVEIDVRNTSAASARLVERLSESFARQLTDNDPRLSPGKGAELRLVVTLLDWREARRSSTKYVSETRQVGTKQVKDKDGKVKTEPVYEYGRNRPSVVIDAEAGLRVEVRAGRGASLADETVRHAIRDEHLIDAGPPSREEIEEQLLDRLVHKAAARISPGRSTVRVPLARSNEVDRLNALAQNRRWHEWLEALAALPPHADRKRDAYRLHNLAVAHEALAYEASDPEDWTARLTLASTLIRQARTQNTSEKYIEEAVDRILASGDRYQQLATLHRAAATSPGASPSTAASAATHALAPPAGPAGSAPMTNQDVIDLRTAGLDDDNLIAAITGAGSVRFDLSAAGLRALLAGKVSNRVITAMRSRAR